MRSQIGTAGAIASGLAKVVRVQLSSTLCYNCGAEISRKSHIDSKLDDTFNVDDGVILRGKVQPIESELTHYTSSRN